MTWPGTEPELPSVLLNSHTDVAPVYPELWKYPPFSAHKDEKGDIYARGSQDMKCVGIQYIEAVKRLKKNGVKCKRNIHLSYVPDEVISGYKGMKAFLDTESFKKMNVGVSLDEGTASVDNIYRVYYAERAEWWLEITCRGNPGHGSKFIENTAIEKAHNLIGKFLAFREEQRLKLINNPELTPGDVISVNVTELEGGVEINVVPAEIKIGIDMRVPPTVDFDALEAQIKEWMASAGSDIILHWRQANMFKGCTAVDASNPFWTAFEETMTHLSLPVKKEIFMAFTDSKYLRKVGIPALGFSPIVNTPQLLHDDNEYLNDRVFLDGISIYEKLLPAIANA